MNITNSFVNIKYETWVLRQNVRCHCIIEKKLFSLPRNWKVAFLDGVMKRCPLKYVWGMWGVLLD